MRDVALYPGTFDPITCGHLGVIKKITAVFKQVVVGVSTSRQGTLLAADVRLRLVQESCHGLSMRCELYDGLTAIYAKRIKAGVIVRGIRSIQDFAPEQAMVAINSHFAPEVVTMFVMADCHLSHLSSTLVKEVHAAGGDLDGMVTAPVREYLGSAR